MMTKVAHVAPREKDEGCARVECYIWVFGKKDARSPILARVLKEVLGWLKRVVCHAGGWPS